MIRIGDTWLHLNGQVICPDELRLEQIGEADGWRGRVVRYAQLCWQCTTGVRRGASVEDRFWAKVQVQNECWVWTGSKSLGYGRFYVSAARPRVRAPRFAWELANGPIPVGMWVLHRCDNPSCVRPDHLFLGSGRDNVDDRTRKLRSPNLKLTPAQVRDIRTREGVSQRALAREFGVSQRLIQQILKRKSWVHV